MWENSSESTTIMKKISFLEKDITLRKNLVQKADDVEVLFEFLNENQVEEKEVKKELKIFSNLLKEFELKLILNGDNDINDAIITIHPGAGGTESQDWAEMLYRMYSMWAESKGFKFNVIDLQNGDEAGLKDCTVEISGDYAYGLLQAEIGIHRLVRISPFDSNSRRHTSFASVSVSPAVDEDIDIEINQKDLRIDTFRSSGAGGQHVNKTDSAVRLTHIPSGIVVECQDDRSQHKNKAKALALLSAKIYDVEKQKIEQEKASERKSLVGTGDRSEKIRTYNFPQGRVTDHRLKLTLYNIENFLDGDIDEMLDSLKAQSNAEKLLEIQDE